MLRVILGLIALIPAALNASSAQAGGFITMPLCTGDGQVRSVTVPIGQDQGPMPPGEGCCAKGCHTGGSRKKALKGNGADA